MNRLQVNIIGKSNGAGLARDIELLRAALLDNGHQVAVIKIDASLARRRRSILSQLRARAGRSQRTSPGPGRRPADVNLMLEHVWPQYLKAARLNVAVPNPEWFDHHDRRVLPLLDCIWAKTHYTEQVFRGLGSPTTYVGFDSEDRYDGSIARQRTYFHLAGKSAMKGTDRLLEVWSRHPDWPRLIVVLRRKRDLKLPSLPNVDLRVGYLSDEGLRGLQNQSVFHICLSLTEGWGHYIVEALSTAAVTVTVDAAPMNELVTPERGVLVGYRDTGAQRLATTYPFDAAQLESAIERTFSMSDADCRALGSRARSWFLDNKQRFPARLEAALQGLGPAVSTGSESACNRPGGEVSLACYNAESAGDCAAATQQALVHLPLAHEKFREPPLSASLPLRNTGLMAGPRWLNRWWPSRRLGADPLHDLRVHERYAPVSISNWKLIPPVARDLLAQRVPQALSFSEERRLTIIIPYRDREMHLRQLLPPLRATLDEQLVRYRILVVEQQAGQLFNRGRLLNIGMHYAAEFSDYYCLHDVDAVPMAADYRCPSQPLRLIHRFVSSGSERSLPNHYFSGAVSLCKEQAFAANGFSNDYWGWGKEDDDFYFRLLLAGCLCYYDLCGTYRNLPNPAHQQVPRGSHRPRYVTHNRERRSQLLRGLTDPALDGLTNLQYTILDEKPLHGCDRVLVRW